MHVHVRGYINYHVTFSLYHLKWIFADANIIPQRIFKRHRTWEAGEEGARGGRKGKYFATLEKHTEAGTATERGRELGVQSAGGGKFRSPVPPLNSGTA